MNLAAGLPRSLLLRWRAARLFPHAPGTARRAAEPRGTGRLAALVVSAVLLHGGPASGSSTVAVSEMGAPGLLLGHIARYPTVAFHPALGEFMLAWDGKDSDHGFGETEIFVRRMHRSEPRALFGQVRVTALGGIGSSSGGASRPQLLPVSPCAPLVCWMLIFEGYDAGLPSLDDSRIFVLPLSADGLPAAQPRPISRYAGFEREARNPLLVRTGASGSFLALWTQHESGGSGIDGHELYVRRVLVDASTPEVPARVSSGSGHARFDSRPAAAHDTVRDEILVAWLDRDPAQGRDRILARFLGPDGGALTPVLPLAGCGEAQTCFGLALAHDPGSGRYLLLWIARDNPFGGARRVMALAIDALSGPLTEPLPVSSEHAWTWAIPGNGNNGVSGSPSVTWLPRAGRFAAMWKEAEGDSEPDAPGRIVGARLTSDLAQPIDRFVVSDQTGGRVQFAHLAFDGAPQGRTWAVWTADDLHAGDYEVLARQLPLADWRQQQIFIGSFEP